MKYFANIKIKKDEMHFILIKKDNNNAYFNGGIDYKFQFHNELDLKENTDFIKGELNKLKLGIDDKFYTNIIVEDSLFTNLEFDKFICSISKNEIDHESFDINKLPNLLVQRAHDHNKEISIGNEVICYPHTVYVTKDDKIKTYKSIPVDKDFELIEQEFSRFVINKQEPYYILIEKILNQLDLEATNILLKSQIISNSFNKSNKKNFVVDINEDYCAVATVFNGLIIEYTKDDKVGTGHLFKKLANELPNLTKQQIFSRVKYIAKNLTLNEMNNMSLSNKEQKLMGAYLYNYITSRVKGIWNIIHTFIQKNMWTNDKIEAITFSGELVFAKELICAHFKETFETNLGIEVKLLNQSKSLAYIALDDIIIEQAIMMTSNFKSERNQNQTITSEYKMINRTKKSFFQKIKALFTYKY